MHVYAIQGCCRGLFAAPHPPAIHGSRRPSPGLHASQQPEHTQQAQPLQVQVIHERGARFAIHRAFYRPQSAEGRDLAVLAAAVYRRRAGALDVLDLMAGAGVRGLRYLQHAGAQHVWCNDHDRRVHAELTVNLASPVKKGCDLGAAAEVPDIKSGAEALDCTAERMFLLDQRSPVWQWQVAGGATVRVSHVDARRLLASLFMEERRLDLIDADSFGSDVSPLVGLLLESVKLGGLIHLTSTDGFSAAGLQPLKALASFGSYPRAVPWANEQGLRMLIGKAALEAAGRGLNVQPVFSLYSYHGPVFRTMLRVTRSAWAGKEHYGFAGVCPSHGTKRVAWRRLHATCHHCGAPLTLTGPMWTGPLHDRGYLEEMMEEARARGWSEGTRTQLSRTRHTRPLQETLQLLLEEADPRLPPGWISLDSLAQHQCNLPRDALITALRSSGWAAARSHLENSAIRTDAPFARILHVAAVQ